ncbi:hypothetical protein AC249_AIPGENE23047 [Exaiptasia diaphana]|nr:hypothetical protein AC249_AIPGENE23047 [Exaiptasia diaphana]
MSTSTCVNDQHNEEESLLEPEGFPDAHSQHASVAPSDHAEYLDNLKHHLGIDTMREAIENLTSTLDRSTSKRRSRHEAGSARKRSREGEGFDPTEALESLHSSSSSEQGVSDAVEEDDLPPSIFDENESKGPEVSEALAKRVNEAFTVKPLEGKMKLLMDKYKTPSNCELMCVPRVNTTLWNELPRKAHQIDLGLQEAQKAIVKTGQIVVQITDDMLKAKKNKEHLKPSKFSFFTAQNLVNLDEGTTTRDTTKVQPKQELIKIGKHPRQINNVSLICNVGNLATKVNEWSKITSDPWILETIRGYRLEFDSCPWQVFAPMTPNHSESNYQLLNAEVDKLLSKGAIEQVSHVPGSETTMEIPNTGRQKLAISPMRSRNPI